MLPIRRKLERLESKRELSFQSKQPFQNLERHKHFFFETWDLSICLPGAEATRYYGNEKEYIKVENGANFLRLSVVQLESMMLLGRGVKTFCRHFLQEPLLALTGRITENPQKIYGAGWKVLAQESLRIPVRPFSFKEKKAYSAAERTWSKGTGDIPPQLEESIPLSLNSHLT